MEILGCYIENPTDHLADEIRLREKEADEARRILIFELNKTFITPFDREDIFSLSRAIDDVLDYAYSTVSEMEILKVKPTAFMQRIASLLKDAAYELLMAVDRLEEHPGVASEHARARKRWRTGSKRSTGKRWRTCSAARKISSMWLRCSSCARCTAT